RRCGVGSLGAVVGTRPRYQAHMPAPLCAVALLELLATAAPAGVVAPHLVLVVDDPLLHGGRLFLGAEVGHFHAPRRGAGGRGRGGEGARADSAAPARVGDAPGARGAARGGEGFLGRAAVVALDVDLGVGDHARVVAPDAV